MAKSERNIRGASVCVIGGAGFLGSHLVDHLIEDRKCTVLVLDNLITGQKKFVHKDATFVWCDITQSEERMRKLFEHYKVEYVFNYAAEPYIPVSFERPLHVFDTNARAALMILNAAQDAGVKGILQVSSAEIYGGGGPIPEDLTDKQRPLSETAVVQPHSSYGAAKAAIDFFVQSRWREAKTPAIALRQFNCVGERETHPYVVPEIISQIQKAYKTYTDNPSPAWAGVMINLGNDSFRDFLYAGDAVRMAVELLEKGKFGEVYNSGSEQGIKIYELAKLIGECMGMPLTLVKPDPAHMRPWEIWHLQSDNTKLYSVIDYRPRTDLTTALAHTIEYFRKNNYAWDF